MFLPSTVILLLAKHYQRGRTGKRKQKSGLLQTQDRGVFSETARNRTAVLKRGETQERAKS